MTQLGEFEDPKLENLKVHVCSNCDARFLTQRDLILTQIPSQINTMILEEIHSTPSSLMWDRFSALRKESTDLLEELEETIPQKWHVVRSDPYFRPCEECGENALKIQNFKFDGAEWLMLT